MKRAFEPEPGKPKKHRYVAPMFNEALNEGNFELRLLIPSKFAGGIIGKGGMNINQVSSQYNASMSMPDCSRPERVLAIICPQETILDCFRSVVRFIMADSKRSNIEIRLLVNDSHAGVVLGRKGSFVKEITDTSGVDDVHVYKEVCPMSSDRVVQITGVENTVVEAVGIIIRELSKFPIKGPQQLYDPSNYDPIAAPHYGGYTDGRIPAGSSMPSRGGGGGRAPERVGHSGSMGNSLPTMTYGEDYLRGTSDNMTLQVAVPKEMIGQLAANGGEFLQYLEQESGAQVSLSVSLTGPERWVRMGQLLLKDNFRGRAADAMPTYYDETARRPAEKNVPSYYDESARQATGMVPPSMVPPPPPTRFFDDAQTEYNSFKNA